jgi:hypothetical protein
VSAAQQIAKLEGLLARIRSNAAARGSSGAGAVLNAVLDSFKKEATESVRGAGAPSSRTVTESVVSRAPVSAAAAYASPSTIPIEDVDIEELDGELVESDREGAPDYPTDAVTFAPEVRSGDASAPALVSAEATLPLDLHAVSTAISNETAPPSPESATLDVGAVTVEMTAPTAAEAALLAEMNEPPLEMAVEVSTAFTEHAPGFGEHPTMEQLGATVELEGSDGEELEAELELDTAAIETSAAPAHVEEAPVSSFAGAYDESLRPPPEAQHDLEAHDHRSDVAHMVPHVVGRSEAQRPIVVAEIIDDRRPFAGRSFGELLDEALRLTD